MPQSRIRSDSATSYRSRAATARAFRWVSSVTAALALGLLLMLVAVPSGARQAPFPEVSLEELPAQARTTLVLIRNGGPFPYSKDGTFFGNRERLLPIKRRGYYTEYTVPTPRSRDRGARRIIVGGDPARSFDFYYTDDHYASFRKIRDPMQ